MFLLGFAVAFLLLLSSGQCDPFVATISLAAEYPVGEEVQCYITITNTHDQDYFFLKRVTPFEGIMSHIFSITENEKLVDYDGFLFKRGSPSKEEYVLVKANSSVSTVVDLSLAYSFGAASSKYTVKLNIALRYFKLDHTNSPTQDLHSNVEHFLLTASEKPPKLTETEILRRNSSKVLRNPMAAMSPKFSGKGTSGDVNTAVIAYNAAYNVLSKSASSVTSNAGLFKTWFGSYSIYQYTVEGTYLDIKEAMEKYQFTIYFYGPKCESGVVAYTYHRATTVYMCDGYFSAATDKGYDSKMGTIVHEMSHAVAGTKDIIYGPKNCMNLAVSNPGDAIKNADNYEFFAESQ